MSKQLKVRKNGHTGKSKAKTKKQMKKSINSLYKSLQEEKAKHSKASSIVGSHKHTICKLSKLILQMGTQISELTGQIAQADYDKNHTTEVTASLVKEIAVNQ